MFDRILAAIDGSPGSEKALTVATDLAIHYGAELLALAVAEVPEVVATMDEVDEVRGDVETYLHAIGEAAVEFVQSRGVSVRSVIVRGHAADSIIRFAASEQVSLVVLGCHGHSRIARYFLGSTSDRVSEHCHCSVVIVK